MPRGRKFKKLTMSDSEPERAPRVDDDEGSPADDDSEAEGSAGVQWSTTQGTEDVVQDSGRATPVKDGGLHREAERRSEPEAPSSSSSSPSPRRSRSSGVSGLSSAAAPAAASQSAHVSHSSGASSPAAAAPRERLAAESERWQELVAEAAGEEIEAMHWHQVGSLGNAIECYRRVAAKHLEAAESLDKSHDLRKMLEQRVKDALDLVDTLENSQSSPGTGMAPEDDSCRNVNAKLTTEGILASTLASTAGSAADEQACKSSLRSGDAKILGAAVTIGGAAGMLLAGPISAVSLSAMAAYATTREDSTGAAARKVCAASINVTDCAVNKAVSTGLKAADVTLEEGRRRLLEGMDGPNSTTGRWCSAHKEQCIRAVAFVEALQDSLPRRKLSEEARRMKIRHPDRVPVFCSRATGAQSDLPDIKKNKFAMPEHMLYSEFKYIVHREVTKGARASGLAVDQSLFLFVGEAGKQPKTSATMGDLYREHQSEDGFLYIRYTAENTLG